MVSRSLTTVPVLRLPGREVFDPLVGRKPATQTRTGVARTRHYSSEWRVRATLDAISQNEGSGAYAPLPSELPGKYWRVRATLNLTSENIDSGAYAPLLLPLCRK